MVYKSDKLNKIIWGNRAEGVPVPPFDLTREVTPEELAYMHQKFAYVQIANPFAMGEYSEVQFIRAPSGWLVINYKNAMCSSPGEMLFTDAAYKVEDEQTSRLNTGTGTRINQIIETANLMVRLAVEEQNWPAIHVVNGTSLMCWAIWKAAKDLGREVIGYVPSKEEVEKYERIRKSCPALLLQHTPSQTP